MYRSYDASTNNRGNENKSYTDWARHWFAQLARHHRVHDPAKWTFTEQDVIALLRAKGRPKNDFHFFHPLTVPLPRGQRCEGFFFGESEVSRRLKI